MITDKRKYNPMGRIGQYRAPLSGDPFWFENHFILIDDDDYYRCHEIKYEMAFPNGDIISQTFCDDSDTYNNAEALSDLKREFNHIVSKLTAHEKMDWIRNFVSGEYLPGNWLCNSQN